MLDEELEDVCTCVGKVHRIHSMTDHLLLRGREGWGMAGVGCGVGGGYEGGYSIQGLGIVEGCLF